MEQYKAEFIEFMVASKVLTFGDFTTKSGRKTPYFINTGRYRTGAQLNSLANYYADAIVSSQIEFDFLFGPAYKGIPLATATAMALAKRGRDVSFCFNRKEAKDHGEGGVLVGHQPQDGEKALIIEDVTTAGTSLRETIPLLRKAAAINLAGLVVSVDRQERGLSEKNALDQVSIDYQMPAFPIVTVQEVMTHLEGRTLEGEVVLTPQLAERMRSYLREYGGR
ncbi:MAG: orotate phosphoribosyltransferase [Polyangiaceae bacterium]|nr:orotate phosphoribosyltransferase [Polyangiaceae bacterium]